MKTDFTSSLYIKILLAISIRKIKGEKGFITKYWFKVAYSERIWTAISYCIFMLSIIWSARFFISTPASSFFN